MWKGRPKFKCEVHAANNDKWTRPLFRDPCPGHKKYLRVSYDCYRNPGMHCVLRFFYYLFTCSINWPATQPSYMNYTSFVMFCNFY